MILFNLYKKEYEHIINYDYDNVEFNRENLSVEQIQEIIKTFNKDYPDTKRENLKIFKEYCKINVSSI